MPTETENTVTNAIERLAIDTIRTLSMDAVQAANSGHPGTPMALAPVAYALWNGPLKYDPADPLWPGRDRFVLSCGHASMLLYSLIHLTGVQSVDQAGEPTDKPSLSLEELKNFRQWKSRTPGHPEYGHTSGVETTTGPLGQGCGNSVGMAIAQRWLAARYNRPGFELFDYNVYVLCGDGDMMEGVTCEAASLAGHLRLPNLCWIYDDNKITIEGSTDLAFSENVEGRFESLGWNVVRVEDANDLESLASAYNQFSENEDSPTLIIVRSKIGYGSPNKEGSHDAHGAPLGVEEIALTKQAYDWPENETFRVPEDVLAHFQEGIGRRGAEASDTWHTMFARYEKEHPNLAKELHKLEKRELPDGWDRDIPTFEADEKGMATRKSSGTVLNAIGSQVPWLIGGSADLAPSTNTFLKFEGAGEFQADEPAGRNLHYGVREHAMAAAVNGMALSHVRGYGASFFVFTDYCRPSLRLAAIMGIPSIFVFTHDSVGVGEDGPTHQPIEQLAACRTIPNLLVLRPSDANETAEAWRTVMQLKDRPALLVLTRQNLPTICREKYGSADQVARGGYLLVEAESGKPELILIGTGSEVSVCLAAREQLEGEGIPTRVVSLPCWKLFDEQEKAYRDAILPPNVTARVAVEAGIRQGWDRYLGSQGQFVGIDHFGASAPAARVMKEFGITPENVVEQAKMSLRAAKN